MMHDWRYFLSLTQQVHCVVAHFWPLALLLAATWVWAFAATKPLPRGGRWRIFALGCLPPFMFPVAILTIGVACVADPLRAIGVEQTALSGCLIAVLVFGQLPLAGLACWWWGERWLAVAASWVCGGCLSLAAALVSTMSVTGNWL